MFSDQTQLRTSDLNRFRVVADQLSGIRNKMRCCRNGLTSRRKILRYGHAAQLVAVESNRCATVLGVFRMTRDENVVGQSAFVGKRLSDCLNALAHVLTRDVRQSERA